MCMAKVIGGWDRRKRTEKKEDGRCSGTFQTTWLFTPWHLYTLLLLLLLLCCTRLNRTQQTLRDRQTDSWKPKREKKEAEGEWIYNHNVCVCVNCWWRETRIRRTRQLVVVQYWNCISFVCVWTGAKRDTRRRWLAHHTCVMSKKLIKKIFKKKI